MISLHNEFIKKYKKEKWIILITQLVILFVFIFLWEILSLTNIIDPFIFSRPSQILSLFVKYLSSNELLIHTLVSTYEVVIGLPRVIAYAKPSLLGGDFLWLLDFYKGC